VYNQLDKQARGITANVVVPREVQTDFSGGMVRDNPEVNWMVAIMTAQVRAGVPVSPSAILPPIEDAQIQRALSHGDTINAVPHFCGLPRHRS
jgi:hypothetical protein